MALDLKVSKTFDAIWNALNSGLYRLIVAYGSSRSGKSYSIMQAFIILLLKKRNFKITVWRATRVDAVGTILEDFKNIVDGSEYISKRFKFNKKDATFECKRTKSKIYFMGTDVVSKVLGMRQNISFFNEISHFSHEVYLQIVQRTEDFVLSDYNPSGDVILDRYKGMDTSIFLRSTFMDNLEFLSDGIVNQLKGYNPYEDGSTYVSDCGTKLMYKGSEVSMKNQPPPHKFNIKNGTADLWHWMVYGLGISAEKPNRIYKEWGESTVKYYKNLEYKEYTGLDFGISAPTAVVDVKFDGDRTFYIHQRLYKPASTFGMPIYKYLKDVIKYGRNDLIVADSAKQTMIDDLTAGGLLAVGALKGAGSIQRRISQVQGFKIYFTNTSNDIRQEYLSYEYKLDKFGVTTDDINPSTPNHLLDATGYIISYLVSYLGIKVK